MNSINSIINQQATRVTANSALRKAAVSPELPTLTKDESTLINQKFTTSKQFQAYSMDGRVSEQQAIRGANFDARV